METPIKFLCNRVACMTWDCALTLAPFVTKTLTTSACPANDAICRAVFPFCKIQSKISAYTVFPLLTFYKKKSNISMSPKRMALENRGSTSQFFGGQNPPTLQTT